MGQSSQLTSTEAAQLLGITEGTLRIWRTKVAHLEMAGRLRKPR